MPGWVSDAFAEYAKRVRDNCEFKLIEIPAVRRGKNADVKRIARDEGQKLLAAVPANSRIIALERTGKAIETETLSKNIQEWMNDGVNASLLVGGPEGLSPEVLQAADETWSLSAMTLAHPVVRAMVAEQVYRAWSIAQGLPYHRGG
ncbi:MAG: 23S rRNA (pseudouridine(1915)-N(3))-methyltransferase RlmH [Gammaproteobacteria bacterium]|nr:23S rRNA (pseudouridine(1915)-N(3))-methyltransferase RlmH [Gammaproteobacteria bacterium]